MSQENSMDGLVGPRSHERVEKEKDDVSSEGESLYMALIPEEETLVLESHTVQEAKNKFLQMKEKYPQEIASCKGKKLEECRTILQSLEKFSQAA